MNMGIITLNHGRLPILELFAAGIERLRIQTGDEIPVVCAGGRDGADICRAHGIIHIEHENRPVSRKWDAALAVFREMPVSHVMVLGSDDLINLSLYNELKRLSSREPDLVGVQELYMYALTKDHVGKLLRFSKPNVVLGPCRVMPRKTLDAVDWRPWRVDRNSGMDGGMMRIIKPHVRTIKLVPRGNGMVVDVKGGLNINNFTAFIKQWRNNKITEDMFLSWLSDKELDIIDRIKSSLK